MLMAEVQRYDPKQNASVTIGSNYMPWENAQLCADIVKVAGYNYAEKYYEASSGTSGLDHLWQRDRIGRTAEASIISRMKSPFWPMTTSSVPPLETARPVGAKSAEACILAERDMPFSLGQFIWTGFDYIGEPTPYHTKTLISDRSIRQPSRRILIISIKQPGRITKRNPWCICCHIGISTTAK